jgi:ankyrin repeat protein
LQSKPVHSFEHTLNSDNLTDQLRSAVRRNDLEATRELLKAGADANGMGDEAPSRMLDYAIRKRASYEICCLLLDHGAQIVPTDPSANEPLYIAALMDDIRMCRELVRRGADPSVTRPESTTPLSVAALTGSVDLCRYLIEMGASVHGPNHEDCTPMHYAVLCPDPTKAIEICHLLMAAGASSDYTPTSPEPHYATPFQRAVINGMCEVTELLVTKYGEDPAQKTRAGRSMVEIALKDEMRRMLRMMLAEHTINSATDTGLFTADVTVVARRFPSPL